MEYYLGFLVGFIGALAICLAIIKYCEVKQEKEFTRPDNTPVQFTVDNVRSVPITVELIVTREDLLYHPHEYFQKKLNDKLAEEVAKYTEVITEENPMNFTTKIRARVAVVEGRGGFR